MMENGEIDLKRDKELEENILGCLLNDSKGLENGAVAKLNSSDFQYDANQIVFNTIIDLYTGGESVDVVTVSNRLKEVNKLEKIGGAYWLTGLVVDNLALNAHLSSYAETLIDYTRHNNQIKMTEKVRLGKKDFSELLKMGESERQKEYPQSDSGNAEILRDLFNNDIKYDHDSGMWKIWDGTYWKPDSKRQVYDFATKIARKRQEQSLSLSDSAIFKSSLKPFLPKRTFSVILIWLLCLV